MKYLGALLLITTILEAAADPETTENTKEYDWDTMTIKTTTSNPNCTGTIKLEFIIPRIENIFMWKGEDRKVVYECIVAGKVLSEKGNILATWVDTDSVVCAKECQMKKVEDEYKWIESGGHYKIYVPTKLHFTELVKTKEQMEIIMKKVSVTTKSISQKFSKSSNAYLRTLHRAEKDIILQKAKDISGPKIEISTT